MHKIRSLRYDCKEKDMSLISFLFVERCKIKEYLVDRNINRDARERERAPSE